MVGHPQVVVLCLEELDTTCRLSSCPLPGLECFFSSPELWQWLDNGRCLVLPTGLGWRDAPAPGQGQHSLVFADLDAASWVAFEMPPQQLMIRPQCWCADGGCLLRYEDEAGQAVAALVDSQGVGRERIALPDISERVAHLLLGPSPAGGMALLGVRGACDLWVWHMPSQLVHLVLPDVRMEEPESSAAWGPGSAAADSTLVLVCCRACTLLCSVQGEILNGFRHAEARCSWPVFSPAGIACFAACKTSLLDGEEHDPFDEEEHDPADPADFDPNQVCLFQLVGQRLETNSIRLSFSQRALEQAPLSLSPDGAHLIFVLNKRASGAVAESELGIVSVLDPKVHGRFPLGPEPEHISICWLSEGHALVSSQYADQYGTQHLLLDFR